jgi:hypothetical protein
MSLRRKWSQHGLVLGLVLLGLGEIGFTVQAPPAPPGVQAESTWTRYQRIIQSDQRTVAHVRNMRRQTPSHGAPGSPRTRDHRAPMLGWVEGVLIGLFVVLMTGVLTAKRRGQEKGNALSCRIFPL